MTQAEQGKDPEGAVSLEADWSGASAVPVVPSNQFVAQVGLATTPGEPDGIYLTFGHAAPPILLGSPEQARRAATRLEGRLPVTVHSRLLLTRPQLDQLISILQETAEKFDAERKRDE